MARKDNGQTPISLFSFQDIITAVTGIMFLVVLLMVILFMQNYLHKAQPQSESAGNLQQELTYLQKQLQKLQHDQHRFEQSLAEQQQSPPDTLLQRRQLLTQQLQAQRQMFDRNTRLLMQQQRQLQGMKEKLWLTQQLQQQKQASLQLLNQQKIQLEQTLQQTQQNWQRQQKLIKYTVQNASSKVPVLLQLNQSGIQLLKLDTNEYIDFRMSEPADFASLSSGFTRWLNNCPPEQYYFTAIVNPSGFIHAADLLDLLKKHRFERGVEILPDDQSTIMERPAL